MHVDRSMAHANIYNKIKQQLKWKNERNQRDEEKKAQNV